MVFAFKEAHSAFHPVVEQGPEHLHPFRQRTSVIFQRVDEQGRRGHVFGIFQRRLLPGVVQLLIQILSVNGVKVIPRTHVRHKGVAQPIRHGPLAGGSLEAVGMADHPVGHVAAVRTASDAQATGVNLRDLRQSGIRELHQILVIFLAPVSPHVGVVVALAVRAVDVGKEDKVALACPDLHLVEKGRPVNCLWPAVDIEDGRVFLLFSKVFRVENPAVLGIAGIILVVNLNGRSNIAAL